MRILWIWVILGALLAAAGCNARHNAASSSPAAGMEYAVLVDCSDGDGYTTVKIRNPWDTARLLGSFVLVPDTAPLPARIPEGTLIRTPLKKALVYSTTHQNLIAELGALDRIGAVCDAGFILNPDLRKRIETGLTADCGPESSPDIERMIMASPDAILISPYEDGGYLAKVGRLGIPVIECADYMEPSPLGRAEWMKFYGLLFGCPEKADSLWTATRDSYNKVKKLAAAASSRPSVMWDAPYGASWSVPAALSTTGRYVADAGGCNPFAKRHKGAGSVPLAPEQVLSEAADADIWLLRYYRSSPLDLNGLEKENPLFSQFKPFRIHSVYGCNTAQSPLYEEISFHPQLFLAELATLFHPELSDSIPVDPTKRFFTPLP